MSDQPLPQAEHSELDIIYFFQVTWRRKVLIVGGTLIVLIATWFACVNLPKVYQVTVKVWPVYTPAIAGELTAEGSNRVDNETIVKPIVAFFQNYSLADSAIREFELDKSPFNLTASAFLEGNVDARLDRNTNLIHFSVELTDAAMAWEVVNYMAREGIERYSQLIQNKLTRNTEYLASQLEENRVQLKQEGDALTAFQQKANTTSLTGRKYFLQTQSDELAGKIVQAEIELAAKGAEILVMEDALEESKQSTVANASPAGVKTSGEESIQPNEDLASLRLLSERLNEVFQNSETRLIRNKAEYASLQAGKEKMEQTKGETEAELALIEEQLASVSVEEEKLRSKLELTNRMNELTELELVRSRNASELLVQQIAIVDSGGIPEKPVRPRVLLITVISGVVAFSFFTFLAFLMEEAVRRRVIRKVERPGSLS